MTRARERGSGVGVGRSVRDDSVPRRVVVGITGASGAVYGVQILRRIRQMPGVESHAIISRGARSTINIELGLSVSEVEKLADAVYPDADLAAAVSSGSFETAGMVVAPCSIKTLSAIAHCYSDNLIARAADVTLKERRPLVLMVRETPLHLGHIRLLKLAATAGATIFPPVPAFYAGAESIQDLVDYSIVRVMDQLGVRVESGRRWSGREGRQSD